MRICGNFSVDDVPHRFNVQTSSPKIVDQRHFNFSQYAFPFRESSVISRPFPYIRGIATQSIHQFRCTIPGNIGDFGGKAWNTPTAINHQGTIVGLSDFPGDDSGAPNFHAFISVGGSPIQDLKTVGDDPFSLAFGLNENNQVVGQSLDADGNSRAFIWENGKMADLNKLALDGSPFLIYANDINQQGEIVGQACNPDRCAAGETFAFLAIPVHIGGENSSSNQQARSELQKVALPKHLREQLRAQWGLEFGDKE